MTKMAHPQCQRNNDIIIFSDSKEELRELLFDIQDYLRDNLDLEIKSNWQIFPVDKRGIDFVGFRHFRGYTLLRKSTFKDCKKVFIAVADEPSFITEKQWCAWVSCIGWIGWCDSERCYRKYIKQSIPKINAAYDYYKRGKRRKLTYTFVIYSSYFKKKQKKKYWGDTHHDIIHIKEERAV